MTAKIHPIPRSDFVTERERPWMEYVAEHGITPTRDLLVEKGVGAAQAASIAVWLSDQLERRRGVSRDTSRVYRGVLDRIGSIPG
jgi:hypothetical protein